MKSLNWARISRRSSAFSLRASGPGFGVGDKARGVTLAVLASLPEAGGMVLDADGITCVWMSRQFWFEAAGAGRRAGAGPHAA